MDILDFDQLTKDLAAIPRSRRCGHVVAADGGAITVGGLAGWARIGDGILIAKTPDGPGARGEIISISKDGARAMILGIAEGVGLDDHVWLTPDEPLRPSDAWLGRVIDAYGAPLDGRPLDRGAKPAPLRRAAPPADHPANSRVYRRD
mgnify:CR=1 FL=1